MDLSKLTRKVDLVLILGVVALCVYGALMIYSATKGSVGRGGDQFIFLKRQIVWIVLGIIIAAFVSFSDYNLLRHYLVPIYLLNLALLVLVFFVGKEAFGAQRWIPFGSFHLQPSEFAKIFVIVTLAIFLSTRKGEISSLADVGLSFLFIALPWLLIFKQPDLGTALVLFAILMGMLLAAGIKIRYFMAIVLSCVLIGFLMINFGVLKDYQMKRLMVFMDPDIDPLGAGYNIQQSKIAVGSGRLAGKGLFSGTQTNLQFLPARHTDFIFAVVGEELGFLGSALLLGLYFVIISRGIRIASTSKNMLGSLIAIGVVSMWLFQIMVNIGMTIGIMPITGIPLPFISSGGSSLWANMAGVGLLLGIYARRFA
jgi:rod shape determining protein RodA